MPRRVFKKFAFKRHEVAKQWFMTPFRHMLHDPRLWGVQRRWVVPAFAIGLFISFMPFPGHTLMGALAALALRVNIPVAAVSTWASNPATMIIMYPAAYQVGAAVLGTPPRNVSFNVSWDWVGGTLVHIWQPMLLGSVLLGAATAIIGYVTLDIVWRLSIAKYKTRKRAGRKRI